MQKKILSRKCLRFFKRTFRGGKFNAEYFQKDYKALFTHVYSELYKFQNVGYSSMQVLKDEKEAKKLFEILEPYVKAVFEHYGVEYDKNYVHGGMDAKTADRFLKGLIAKNKYKQKQTDKLNYGAVKNKSSQEKTQKANKKQKSEKVPLKTSSTDDTVKQEDVLIFHDRKSFEAVYFLAKYKLGEPSEENKKSICQYISKFSLKKDKYLYDAVDETLSDEQAGGGKKKYSVLDKSVWFELNQTFHFYIHVFHLYDDIYYPELYEKQKREGGLINYFKKFFGITDKSAEKDNECIFEKSEKEISPKTEKNISLDFENALKDSLSQRQTEEKSTVKDISEIQKEIEPIIPQKRK